MLVGCPKCTVRLRVNETAQGKAIRCPKCGAVFRLPGNPAIASAPSAESPSPTVRSTESVSTTQSDTAEPKKATKPRKLKPKKKKSNTTVLVVVVLGVVFSLAAVSGGGFAVWYFYFRKTAEQAYTEFLDAMEPLVEAIEKANDPSKRNEVISGINQCNERLERWLAKYRDCEWPEEEFKQAVQKHEPRAKALAERMLKAGLALAFNKQLQQDQEFLSAMKRLASTFNQMTQTRHKFITPAPIGKPAPIPGPRAPSVPFSGR